MASDGSVSCRDPSNLTLWTLAYTPAPAYRFWKILHGAPPSRLAPLPDFDAGADIELPQKREETRIAVFRP